MTGPMNTAARMKYVIWLIDRCNRMAMMSLPPAAQNRPYIVISATNVLDQLFLAQFLHRACPDARLLFYSGDLLFEREIDNVPFVGTLTFTPYPLIGTGSALGGRNQTRAYPDSISQAYFNAASYTIWGEKTEVPVLAGYRNILQPSDKLRPPLWVTAIGTDGYYPLGIASDQASDLLAMDEKLLPGIQVNKPLAQNGPTTIRPSRSGSKR